jgi:hypothetical protein
MQVGAQLLVSAVAHVVHARQVVPADSQLYPNYAHCCCCFPAAAAAAKISCWWDCALPAATSGCVAVHYDGKALTCYLCSCCCFSGLRCCCCCRRLPSLRAGLSAQCGMWWMTWWWRQHCRTMWLQTEPRTGRQTQLHSRQRVHLRVCWGTLLRATRYRPVGRQDCILWVASLWEAVCSCCRCCSCCVYAPIGVCKSSVLY